ncbi:MAG: trigger factor [Candidatus Binatia bacterium]|nr:MAG: trigger factor [Candidatus Binatia bacterium]
MKVRVETLSPVEKRLEVELPEDRVTEELERAFERLARRIELPGFRRGRVPRSLLERRFGEQIRSEVVSRLIEEAYQEAVRQENLQPLGPPEIVTEETPPGRPLRFGATVEVCPLVELRDYSGLELERPRIPVTEADVENALERLRQSYAQLRPVEGRDVVEAGDVVIVDYEARDERGVVGRGEGRAFEVGTPKSFEPFATRLLGARVGEALEFPFAFPPESSEPGFAGRTVHFRVHVRQIARKEVPELDDEFAKDHGECDSLEELRARIRARLEQEAAGEEENVLRARALDELAARHDVELPRTLVRSELEFLLSRHVDFAWWRTASEEQRMEVVAELRAKFEPLARRHVKTRLVLDAIAEREGIEVAESEVDRALAREGPTRSPEEWVEARRRIRDRLRREKALDLVLARARIREGVLEGQNHVAGEPETG